MARHQIHARPPRGPVVPPRVLTGDDVSVYLQDAARTPGGHTPLVALPETEGQVVHLLLEPGPILPVGAQSSLTGGATPFGERLVSLSRMCAMGPIQGTEVAVGSGVAISTLEDALQARGLFYPPAPTFRGASVGGTASTNAAGAATFKYGSTRAWIRGLTVVLAGGEVLDIVRGECAAHAQGYFEILLAVGGPLRVDVPTYAMPDVPKRSAGYHAEPGMDLVDLFVGSEGTLGVITEVRLGALPEPVRLSCLLGLEDEARALDLVGRLREASRATRASSDPRGVDVASIESLDRRCVELLREAGADRENGVPLRPTDSTVLLFEAELPRGTSSSDVFEELGGFGTGPSPDTPSVRLCRLLHEHGALEPLEVALPGDTRRAAQFHALREAVPVLVNHRIGALQRTDPRVHKTAADMIVPFSHLPGMMGRYREAFARRGLDHALWGHVSDGNVHANVLPRSGEDVLAGEAAILEIGEEVIRLGGCPLSEHGVGRSPAKQALLRRLYGESGLQEMRRVKWALDPGGKLSPGVLFPWVSPPRG